MLVKIEEMNKEEVLVVSSRQIAEDFEKRHNAVVEIIDKKAEVLTTENMVVKDYFIETSYTHRGNTYKEYLLTRDGFSYIVMGFTGEKADLWKLKYISAFNEMEKELKRLYEERKKWEIERAKGVVIRHVLTDTIKMKVTDSPNKRFAYPNYTKLIYSTIFKKSFAELKQEYGIKGKESLRDYLTSEELKEVESMEMLVSSLIGLGMGYEEIKQFIQARYQPMLQAS